MGDFVTEKRDQIHGDGNYKEQDGRWYERGRGDVPIRQNPGKNYHQTRSKYMFLFGLRKNSCISQSEPGSARSHVRCRPSFWITWGVSSDLRMPRLLRTADPRTGMVLRQAMFSTEGFPAVITSEREAFFLLSAVVTLH